MTDVYMRSDNNFLQGLYFDQSTRLFYESTGLYGQSKVQKLVPSDTSTMSLISEPIVARKLTGESATPVTLYPTHTQEMSSSDFGEGLSPRSATELVLLTWRERNFYVLSRDTMNFIDVVTLDS